MGVQQDVSPGLSFDLAFNHTQQFKPSILVPPPPPIGSCRTPTLSSSGTEAAEAAALFSWERRQNPTQLESLMIMLWVTTAYFFLPFLCA